MDAPETCPTCGDPLTVPRCLRCENQSSYRFVHRELVILAVLVGVAVATFFVTHSFAASNEALRRQDGRAWYAVQRRICNSRDSSHAVVIVQPSAGITRPRSSASGSPSNDRNSVQVRTEFIEFLLNHGERDRALSERLVLDASLPDDGPSQLAAGTMLLAAGDPSCG